MKGLVCLNNRFDKNITIPLSLCDNTGKLSIYNIFTLFMDIATEHAEQLKLSSSDLGEDLFWLTIRTKVKIINRPEMSQNVTLSTWPEKPARVRANRHYLIGDENGILIQGKSEWTVVNTKTGKIQRVSDIYPDGFDFLEELAIEENYTKISDDFSTAYKLCDYTIRSTDIDLVQHMNNAAYIRALIGAFTTKDLENSPIKEIEITYKAQSYERETLSIMYREAENAVEYGMIKPDGTVCTTVRIVRG